jgi:hypothetical protein
MLLMRAPYTGPAQAYNVGDEHRQRQGSFTPDQPLGNGMPGALDPPQAPIAPQRWGSDGGAVL